MAAQHIKEWNSKLPQQGVNIFSKMSALAQKHQAIKAKKTLIRSTPDA